jgi:hypothetical protein
MLNQHQNNHYGSISKMFKSLENNNNNWIKEKLYAIYVISNVILTLNIFVNVVNASSYV